MAGRRSNRSIREGQEPVGSHLAAVGFGDDPAVFNEQMRQLLDVVTPRGSFADDRLRVYRHDDPSGAAVTVTIEDDRVTCLTPGFRSGARLRGVCGTLFDDDCPYERPVGIEAAFAGLEIPLAVTIDDLAISEAAYRAGTTLELEVSAMAETIEVFADEAAYRASGTPMAVESLIPSGLFAPGGDPAAHQVTSRILLSGVVTSAERRRHSLFGHPFVVIRVRCMGTDWPVAVDPGDLGALDAPLPSPGAIVSARLWLSGHLAP